ncbi:hypothetical protein TNCV_1848381 [Trichonephila clavipes]|nr:hypothetical protein TNCV_1848381 [Trichonephila clavipes]
MEAYIEVSVKRIKKRRITTQTSMPYPGFEPSPYGTVVSVPDPIPDKQHLRTFGDETRNFEQLSDGKGT